MSTRITVMLCNKKQNTHTAIYLKGCSSSCANSHKHIIHTLPCIVWSFCAIEVGWHMPFWCSGQNNHINNHARTHTETGFWTLQNFQRTNVTYQTAVCYSHNLAPNVSYQCDVMLNVAVSQIKTFQLPKPNDIVHYKSWYAPPLCYLHHCMHDGRRGENLKHKSQGQHTCTTVQHNADLCQYKNFIFVVVSPIQ